MGASSEILAVEEPPYVLIGITWGTGCVEHVVDCVDIPGLTSSRVMAFEEANTFVAVDGNELPNQGEAKMAMCGKVPGGKEQQVCSIF